MESVTNGRMTGDLGECAVIAEGLSTEDQFIATQAEDIRLAQEHYLYPTIQPRGARLLTTRPHRRSGEVRKGSDGLYRPQTSQTHNEHHYGLVCTVLKVGPDVEAEEIRVGRCVLVNWFAGDVIFDPLGEKASDLWMVGESEIQAVVTF